MTRVLVVGLPAAGKSTVAGAVAALAGWPCVDSDALLERTTGSTARQLLDAHGLDRLRAAESNVLTLLVSMPGPFVACVAPGAVWDPHDRERIRAAGHVVWAKTPVGTLLRRVPRSGPQRDGGAELALREMAQEYEPLYADVADQVLDLERTSPATAARQVVAAVRGE